MKAAAFLFTFNLAFTLPAIRIRGLRALLRLVGRVIATARFNFLTALSGLRTAFLPFARRASRNHFRRRVFKNRRVSFL